MRSVGLQVQHAVQISPANPEAERDVLGSIGPRYAPGRARSVEAGAVTGCPPGPAWADRSPLCSFFARCVMGRAGPANSFSA